MMQASYYDPVKDKIVNIRECSEDDVQGLLEATLAQRSTRGHPTLELMRGDGASLSVSTDGKRAYLVWVNSLGESFHSVGSDPCEGATLIFDYFGSWSEAPQQHLVNLEDAMQCARNFFRTGAADTDRVLFEPD
jgi:Immunity protein Imm1